VVVLVTLKFEPPSADKLKVKLAPSVAGWILLKKNMYSEYVESIFAVNDNEELELAVLVVSNTKPPAFANETLYLRALYVPIIYHATTNLA